jgi:uncharacterized LabA/DUF88 family protein
MRPSSLNLIGNNFRDNYGIFGHIKPSSESGVLQNIDGIPLGSAKYMVSPRVHQEHIAVFIDGANLYAASRALGFDVDYKSLLAYFRHRSYLVRAYYYTALLETEEYSPLRPLVDWLGYNGYSVVTKPAKEFTDATGRRRVKGSVDIEMAVDVLDLTPHLDHVVIFSGDGDLRRLVESVQRRGVRVTVISTIRTQPAMIADDLRRQADAFIDLADLAEYITRRQVEPRTRTAAVSARPGPARATPAEPFPEEPNLPK